MKKFCDLVAGDKVFKIKGIDIEEYTLRTPFTFNHRWCNPDCCAFVKEKSEDFALWVNKSAYRKSESGKSYEVFAEKSLAVKALKEKLGLLIERQTKRTDEAKKAYEKEQNDLNRYLDLFYCTLINKD